MKKVILLVSLSLSLIHCGQKNETPLKAANLPVSLDELTVQKDRYIQQINTLTLELNQVNSAIEKLTVNEKRVLVSAIALKTTAFEHAIDIQANIKTRQNLQLYPELGGKLEQIIVKEGQEVKKGTLLAVIDDAGFQEQIDQMQLQLDLAKTTFERTARLWEQKIGSEMMYLEAKTRYEAKKKQLDQMKKQLAKAKIYAPFDGIIDEIFANQGSNVAPGMSPILRIVNLKSMYVEADVPENYLTAITKGSKAVVEIPVLNLTLNTTIRQTGSYVQPSNRTFRIEAPLENATGQIKPNLNAKLSVIDYINPNAILVPLRTIRENAKGENYVFVLTDPEGDNNYIAKQRFVTLGKTKNEMIEITEGISENDLLVDEGVGLLVPDQKVKRIEQ
ncbi:MAG: efflux RND transporter periplasmic adaptor subunit [Bacteroidetes bacterium]|nr:efflux RND transporter periplasmic adaptor subunit [Bacteroidota bacterium]